MRRGGTLAGLLLLVACVPPARSYDTYEGKAADTAASVASAIETARLAVSVAQEGRAFAPYLSVVLAEAEQGAGGSGDIFATIQPPDQGSARLRHELLALVTRAESVLADLRIAVRWGELDRLPDIARPLPALSEQLDRFAEEHG
jgi:hypothetical protein